MDQSKALSIRSWINHPIHHQTIIHDIMEQSKALSMMFLVNFLVMPHSSGGAQWVFLPHFSHLSKSGKFLLKKYNLH
jgi:hypothetical protein